MNKKWVSRCIFFIFAFAFLLALAFQASAQPVKLKVSSEQANIRQKPDIGSALICQLSQGTILESSGKEGEWYLVEFTTEEGGRVSGYVHESLVIVVESETKEEKIEKIIKPEFKEPEKIPPKPTLPLIILDKPKTPKFSFSLAGGANYVAGGDLNAGAQGLSHYYSFFLEAPETGQIKATHLGYVLGGSLAVYLSSQFSLGVGVDYFKSKRQSSVKYAREQALSTLTARPHIQALPISLFLSYSPLRNFYIKGGAEYYFVQGRYLYRLEQQENWQEWQGKAHAQGFGFFGGIGTEWKISTKLFVFLEVMDRFAKIKGFEGKDTSTNSEGVTYNEEGRLYYFRLRISEENSYPLLFIREKKPTEAGVIEAREATVNLSSINLKLGLRIFF